MRLKYLLFCLVISGCQPDGATAPSTAPPAQSDQNTTSILVYPTKPGVPIEWRCQTTNYAQSAQSRAQIANNRWDAFFAKYELPEAQRLENAFFKELQAETGCSHAVLQNIPAVTIQSKSATGITSTVTCFVNPAFGEVNARAKKALDFIVAQQSAITYQHQIGTPAWREEFNTKRAVVRQKLSDRYYCV